MKLFCEAFILKCIEVVKKRLFYEAAFYLVNVVSW